VEEGGGVGGEVPRSEWLTGGPLAAASARPHPCPPEAHLSLLLLVRFWDEGQVSHVAWVMAFPPGRGP
jgi:hypothetical protein